MIIKDLHIYGYGKLENQRFPNLEQLQIFYGENESGKSTIMSFIHSLLFGFPTKNQNVHRYEPKLHAKYGGRLTLVTKENEIIIERVKGKATGDVKVTFSDGRIGGEEDLNEILHGIDKNYYQSIFSFDLQGLQGLHTLSEGTMSKYLLSAGLIGNDKLLEVETKLQKELDLRFKPSGQKPLLNRRIKELRELQKQIKIAEEEQRSYTALRQEENNLKSELAKIMVHIQEIETKLVESSSFLRIKPLLEEREEVEARLSNIKAVTFPVDGLKRFEQLKAIEIPTNAQLATLIERVKLLEQNITEIESRSFIREHKEKIEYAIEQGALLDKLELELSMATHETRAAEKNIEKIKQELGWDAPDSEISRFDTSTFMKEKIKRVEMEKHRLQKDKNLLDEKYKLQKGRLETTETRLKEIKAQLMSIEKRNELEAIVNKQQNLDYDEVKKQLFDEQIAELENQLHAKKKRGGNHKRSQLINGGLIAFFGLSAIVSFINGQNLVGFILLSTAVILGISRLFSKDDDSVSSRFEQLEEMKRKREALILEVKPFRDMESIKQLLNQDEKLQRQLENELFKYEEREEAFESTIREYATWEEGQNQLNDTVGNILTVWSIPHSKVESNLESILVLLEEWKAVLSRKHEDRDKYQLIQVEYERKSEELFQLAYQIGKEPSTWRDAISTLKQEINQMMEQTAKLAQWKQELSHLMNKKEELMSEKVYLEVEIKQLFTLANVESEEAFRETAVLAEEKDMMQKQWELLNIQLRQSEVKKEQIQAFFKQGISLYYLENLEQKRKDLAKEKSILLEKQSDTRYRIKQLEEMGMYDDLLHRFHEAKAAFNEEAKEWAKWAVAKKLLNKTLDRYKRERLPMVIAEAEQYLAYLTDGRYRKITLDQTDEGLLVERSDGLSFEADEVSRGTAEQIYVSLRIALANHTFEEDPFPLIIDDSFVNFDTNRTKRMLELVKKVSEKRQVFFFTCHEHIMQYFREDHITLLSTHVVTPK